MSNELERIPLAKPMIGDREIELVTAVLESKQLSLGKRVTDFEETWAKRIGTKYAVACSSGTAGLHCCLHALGLGPGDEVITSTFSFVASANVILYTGATPVFADVDPNTFNMTPEGVEAAITPRTKAILIVSIFGYPADIPALRAIAEKHGLAVVEDACQTIDGNYDGRKLGTWGHPAVFGFYANKQMTTAEGGVILTDDHDHYMELKSLVNQGRSDDGQWLVHSRLGFNYRLSDIHSAIGLAQLERLDDILARRARVAGWYQARIAEIDGVNTMYEGPQERSWFVYAPRLDAYLDRDRVIGDVDGQGVSCKPYLPTIHLQPFYRETYGYTEGAFPVAEAISRSTIALPFFPEMTEDQVERSCRTLAEVIRQHRG